MMKWFSGTWFAVVFAVWMVSCSKQESTGNPLVGHWQNENASYIFRSDGRFSVMHRDGELIEGRYFVQLDGKLVLEPHQDGRVGSMTTGYSFGENHTELALYHAFSGTIVLHKNTGTTE
jgi:hypothetical protein